MNEPAKRTAPPEHPVADGRITVRMGGPISGNNWHSPEQHPHGGAYRWSGPGEKASLNIGIRRDREMLAVIDYFMPLIEDQMAGLRIQVDGVDVPHSVHTDINPRCIVARLPARAISSGGHTELAIVLAYTASPVGGQDPRKLGLGVHSVSVVPAEPALPAQVPVSRYETFRRRMGVSRRPRHSGDFPLSYFDGLAYLEACPDVADAVIAGTMPSALEHYRRHGSKDGRRFTLAVARAPNEGGAADIFDGVAYLDMYPDVADAVRSETEPSAFEHFLKYGRRDGRKIPTRFDGQARRGKAFDLVRLDAIREARTGMDALKVVLTHETATHASQLSARLSTIESALPSLALWSELEAVRAERETRGRELLGDIAALRASSANTQQALKAELEAFSGKLTAAQQQLTTVAQSGELARMQHDALQSKVHKEIAAALTQKQALHEQLESLKANVADAQVRLSAVARSEDLERLRQETLQNLEQVQNELAAQVDAIRSLAAKAQEGISAAALSVDLERLKQDATRELERVRGEIAFASATHEAREQALAAQVEAVRSIAARAQGDISAAARSADLEHLKRDATRELERVRGEIASALTMREAREQAVLEQIELLRISLDDSQRRLSATARAEDLDRLKRDAAQDLERVRSEIASTSAVESARGQALLAQIDTLKAEIDAAKSRAELAEVKVTSVQRELETEAREIAESVKRSAASLDGLRNEIAGANNLRDSNETVIKTELELLKHELSVAQMANLAAPAVNGGKGKSSGRSCSQLGQDLWVLQKTGFKKGGYFVDIGATDGILLSNTYLLEKHYNWKGVCIEPDPAAFKILSKNRKSHNSSACLWSSSGKELDFILAKEYGGISNTADLDAHVSKRRAYKNLNQMLKVITTSLNDLLEDVKAPTVIDYISLDTEGSEYEILSTFDFGHWKVGLWTIEHNFSDQRARIYELMSAHGYKRREVEWDDWYFR